MVLVVLAVDTTRIKDMKWRNRRQSTNVEDERESTAADSMIQKLIQESDSQYAGGAPPEPTINDKEKGNRPKIDYTPDDIKVAKELGRLNREKRTPIPTPRPLNITKTQVTPGKWRTKQK